MKKILFILFILIISCKKEIDIADFSFNYSEYESELRIEALIFPSDSTALIRIDKTYKINDTELYDCRDNDYGSISMDSCLVLNGIWHGSEYDIISDCGNWNSYIHDIGTDGIAAKDSNSDGDYEDFGDIPPDEDGTENNGFPDCGEPNVDNFREILPNIHNSLCEVSIVKKDENNIEESCEMIFDDQGGQFYNQIYTGDRSSPIINNIEIINYGAYIPSIECNKDFWSDYSSQYTFIADCSLSGFSKIKSKDPIKLTNPVVFFLPEDSLNIINCSSYDCLVNASSISNFSKDSLLYFGRYSIGSSVNYASILPNVTYQAVQYMYDANNDIYYYYHGHPAIATEMFNIIDSVAVMAETIVTEFYDGEGNGTWDRGEIYADINQDTLWNEGEYFIDSADNIPEVDTYYYEIFTFSDSYKKYYFNDQLYLDDVERSNLRDENGQPILGAFGSMSSKKIYFKIIDCTIKNIIECEDDSIVKSVCEWKNNISLSSCGLSYEGPLCVPKGFSTSYCE